MISAFGVDHGEPVSKLAMPGRMLRLGGGVQRLGAGVSRGVAGGGQKMGQVGRGGLRNNLNRQRNMGAGPRRAVGGFLSRNATRGLLAGAKPVQAAGVAMAKRPGLTGGATLGGGALGGGGLLANRRRQQP